jgi:hypothetical protein
MEHSLACEYPHNSNISNSHNSISNHQTKSIASTATTASLSVSPAAETAFQTDTKAFPTMQQHL